MKYKELNVTSAVRKGPLWVFREAYGYKDKKRKVHKPQPVLLLRYGNPYVMVMRYSEDVNKLEEVKRGAISWDDFKEAVTKKGYEEMMSGNTRVKPQDVIQAEKVQTEKERVKLETAGFMLQAARYFSGNLYVCPNCGHKMIPDMIEGEEKMLDEPANKSDNPSTK